MHRKSKMNRKLSEVAKKESLIAKKLKATLDNFIARKCGRLSETMGEV